MTTSAAPSPSYKTHNSFKLDLLKFSGEPVKGQNDLVTLDGCMQKEKNLTDAEKITYFKTAMKFITNINKFMIGLEWFSNITSRS